ncbi:MAG: hypothetical protein EZS28_026606 [Streblomastix strix]|uniref:Tc1-like transposase DDE domain-containing protein n=1 Tax=Streblomastix strix TaxID=222440 RepID=A0A5J4V5J9_9EUKA|nr:MAG: hypothetical protein EZS28_026606 [Streblomastix strix]
MSVLEPQGSTLLKNEQQIIEELDISWEEKEYCQRKQLTYAIGLKCCKRTGQYLLKRSDRSYTIQKMKLYLSPASMAKRKTFARNHLADGDLWNYTVFSDEKRFKLEGPDGCRKRWLTQEEAQQPVKQSKNPKASIMVWGAVTKGFKPDLFFVKGIIEIEAYLNMIQKHFIPASRKFFGRQKFRFQQDNAPPHVSQEAIKELDKMKLELLEWPPKSPDLNIIENVWSELTTGVYMSGQPYKNFEDLKEVIIKTWAEIPQEKIDNVVDSMI